MVVGLRVQIKADDGQHSGSENCQRVDLFGKQIGHDVKTAFYVEHETDQPCPSQSLAHPANRQLGLPGKAHRQQK